MCYANLSNIFIKFTKALRSIFTEDGCPQIPKSFGIKISDMNGRQLYEIRLPNLLVVFISLAPEGDIKLFFIRVQIYRFYRAVSSPSRDRMFIYSCSH